MSSSGEYFHWLDYLVFSAMLLVSCGIGVYHSWKARTQSQANYLMGNRQMEWWAVALSLMVSFYSGVSQIGKPAEIYLYGIQYSLGMIGIALCVIFTMYTFVPLLFKLDLTSSFEYLELRFQSQMVRRVGSLVSIITQMLFCGVSTYIPAMALGTVTGIPVWTSILCVGAVATFYTMLGGLKAVVWADVFQFVIMIAGMVITLIFGLRETGGWQKMWEINEAGGKLNFFNFDPNPVVRMSFWSVIIGTMFTWLPYFSVNQASVQRYCSVPTLTQAKMVLLVNLASLCVLEVMVYLSGLLVYSYFAGCDPLSDPDPDQRLASPNQLLPLLVMRVVRVPGLPGVFLASIFSGSFSTVSSCLNALAAVTWEDFLKIKFHYLSERTKTNILKIMVLLYGVAAMVFAFMATLSNTSAIQVCVSFVDTASSPLVGLFLLGAFFRRTNWLGAIIGSCVGFVLPMWMSIGSFLAVPGTPPANTSVAECAWNGTSVLNTTSALNVLPQPVEGLKKLYTVSFLWFPLIGTLTTIVIGFLTSIAAAPFIQAVGPADIQDRYILRALDCWFGRNKRTSDKKDALHESELKEFTT